MNLIIRPATRADLPALMDLYHQLHPDEPPWPSEEVAAEVLEKVLAHPGTTLYVGTLDGRVVCTCVLVISPNFSRCGRSFAIIENVVTDEAHCGRGLGRQILHHAIEVARAAGCYRASLLTGSKREETLRFYDRTGMSRNKTAFEVRFI